jgi:hypothetical protein
MQGKENAGGSAEHVQSFEEYRTKSQAAGVV